MPTSSKLYTHFEGSPEYTQIVKKKPDENRTASDLCREFSEAYASKHQLPPFAAGQLQLVTEKGRVVGQDEPILFLFGQGDIFVHHDNKLDQTTADPLPDPASAAPSSTDSDSGLQGSSPTGSLLSTKDEEDIRRALPHPGRASQLLLDAEQLAKLPTCFSSTIPEQALSQLVAPYIARAEEAEQQKMFKIAATIYEQVCLSLPCNGLCFIS